MFHFQFEASNSVLFGNLLIGGRGMVEPLFTKEHIENMRPHIRQTVNSLLDAVIKAGCEKPVDIVQNFALPVPSYVRILP